MPSRPAIAAILVLWLATLAFAFYRDVWPLLFASGPPPIAVDLEDEARSSGAAKGIGWRLLRGDQKVGRLSTKMEYVDTDDTFRFTTNYSDVRLDFAALNIVVRLQVPHLTTTTRVTRSGDLREQTMDGKLELLTSGKAGTFLPLAEAEAKVEGRVESGRLVGHCDLKTPLGNIDRDLDPVPVPSGHALDPLQPVSRLANVRPGRRWVVREVNPLEEAIAALFKDKLGELARSLPERKREPLIAEVLSDPEPTTWNDMPVSCWVIEYRGGDVRARTWVRVSDGKVLRQEALLMGERLAIERSE
jgi:hypothetical protein